MEEVFTSHILCLAIAASIYFDAKQPQAKMVRRTCRASKDAWALHVQARMLTNPNPFANMHDGINIGFWEQLAIDAANASKETSV